jgi:UDP-2-acetamido-3-amino-2,3-dideoxy-glucuronate N-acetyltransferase
LKYDFGMSIHPKSDVHESVKFGESLIVWEYSKIRENCVIGDEVVIGQSVYIGSGVTIGDRVKIQNNALVYEPATIGNGVFIGPGVILTNDKRPRAINPDLTLKRPDDWVQAGVKINDGASIGAGAILIAPVEIGKWAMIGAGAVVTKDVPDHAVVIGNPARIIGFVDAEGKPAG